MQAGAKKRYAADRRGRLSHWGVRAGSSPRLAPGAERGAVI